MLNKEKHKLFMGKILQDFYKDTTISSLLGFKGGTCAYFFYDLPRFSVDLDFDLLKTDEDTQKLVMEKIKNILAPYGEIKDEQNKFFTLFFKLSYGDGEHNIKVEINKRAILPNIKTNYEIREFLGVSMLIAKKDYLFASKLNALVGRQDTAARDIYDICFFGKGSWDIDRTVLELLGGKNTNEFLSDCVAVIEKMEDNQVLSGLGELISEKEKNWIKNNMKKEAILVLKNYMNAFK